MVSLTLLNDYLLMKIRLKNLIQRFLVLRPLSLLLWALTLLDSPLSVLVLLARLLWTLTLLEFQLSSLVLMALVLQNLDLKLQADL